MKSGVHRHRRIITTIIDKHKFTIIFLLFLIILKNNHLVIGEEEEEETEGLVENYEEYDNNSNSNQEVEETIIKDYIICRHCGADIGLSNFLLNKISPEALFIQNITVFNTSLLVQELEVAVGIRIRVIVLKRATCSNAGLLKYRKWTESFSWFPTYLYKSCLCPKCSSHMGWMFDSVPTSSYNINSIEDDHTDDHKFFVINLKEIVLESFVNSLLIPVKIAQGN